MNKMVTFSRRVKRGVGRGGLGNDNIGAAKDSVSLSNVIAATLKDDLGIPAKEANAEANSVVTRYGNDCDLMRFTVSFGEGENHKSASYQLAS